MTVADVGSPLDGFLAKLERRMRLPADVRADFAKLPIKILQRQAGDIVLREGDASEHCLFVETGFVSRRKRIGNSSQIVGVGIAGDAVDLQSLWFSRNDHSLKVHCDTNLIAVEHQAIKELCDEHAILSKVLWHDSLVDAAIFREWTLNVGHRRARARLAHFFLELSSRMQAHGLIEDGDDLPLPLTQSDLASALGLSLVHTNKSLRSLKDCRQALMMVGVIRIFNKKALVQETGFDPAYLHIGTAPQL